MRPFFLRFSGWTIKTQCCQKVRELDNFATNISNIRGLQLQMKIYMKQRKDKPSI